MDKIDKLLRDIETGEILNQVPQSQCDQVEKISVSSSNNSGTRLVCMSKIETVEKEDKAEGK